VAPGRYEATVVADGSRPVTLTATDASGATTTRVIVADPAAEYRFRPTDDALLKSLASATEGSWMPAAAALSVGPADRHSERRPLWPVLTMIALGLWFVDLLLRRIRVFEPQAHSEDHSERAAASEPRARSAPAKRRARERVGESEGRSPSAKVR
jgi:hypothetical protein